MTRSKEFISLIARGDMRGASDAYISKKGAHGGNMVSPVKRARRRR
jgi:hypothetical protein